MRAIASNMANLLPLPGREIFSLALHLRRLSNDLLSHFVLGCVRARRAQGPDLCCKPALSSSKQ
jgi:hypothetical protein